MKSAILRNTVLPVVLAGSFILLDLFLDRHFDAEEQFDWAHLILASAILLLSYYLMNRAVNTARRVEAAQRAALDTLESRVTERTAELQQANEALRTSEETARALMNALPESALLLDGQGVILEANETAAQRLAVPHAQLVGTSLFGHFAADVQERRLGYLRHIQQTRGPFRFVDERDGRIYDTHVNPILDAGGNVIKLATFSQDITERQRIDERLRHLSSFPQLNPNPVLEVDAAGSITFYNPATALTLERLGLGADPTYLLPDDLTAILQELDQERDSRFEREVRVADATFAETIHVIPASAVLRIYCFDITERERVREELAASEAKYRLLFQNMAEGFALYELLYDERGNPADWQILEVNDAYSHHTGIPRDQIVGRRISELFPAAIPEYLPRFAAVVATQIPYEFETFAQAVGRYQRVSTFPAGGRRFASIIEDITQRKRSEETLRQTQAALALDIQKRSALEERQRLARELHDSVSQALYGVSLGVHTALVQLDTDHAKTREALDFALSLAQAGLMEMRALIFELRPESLEREGLVAALARQVEALRARHHIEVEVSLCDEPAASPPAKEACYRIAQEALQNAVRHARAGRLTIHLTSGPDGLLLEVGDDGVGFNSAADYPGHLGLRSMQERAQQAGGTLDVISAPGSGTRIRAQIPLSMTEAPTRVAWLDEEPARALAGPPALV